MARHLPLYPGLISSSKCPPRMRTSREESESLGQSRLSGRYMSARHEVAGLKRPLHPAGLAAISLHLVKQGYGV